MIASRRVRRLLRLDKRAGGCGGTIPLTVALVAVGHLAVAPIAAAQVGLAIAGLEVGFANVSGRSSGRFQASDSYGMSAVAMARVRPMSRGAVIAGVNGEVSGSTSAAADCVPFTRCTPSFPAVAALGFLAGWELRRGSRGATLRATVGPVLVMPVDFATTGGAQARIDVSTPSIAHVAVIGYAHHIAALGADKLGVSSFGIGLRLR